LEYCLFTAESSPGGIQLASAEVGMRLTFAFTPAKGAFLFGKLSSAQPQSNVHFAQSLSSIMAAQEPPAPIQYSRRFGAGRNGREH
jgi:hypothetical protein